ncbi:OB-fold protein [Frigoriglobus tundricola]|uniref:Uncharacterized protein n=1 Tax=Frigoriglobus tundricola TaxID=2774151 RepID=A0A6M5Z0F5_9BACT|nr:hypothetical protein [Frigoriglobus tundricola]QJW99274.1 hypothetical protein FTUN_6876 [Frigoriglobus tundricola]
MIEFTCPGCLSQCVAEEAFGGMKARCLVCGAFIRIPHETGTVAIPLGPASASPFPARGTRPPTPGSRPLADFPGDEEDDYEYDGDHDPDEEEEDWTGSDDDLVIEDEDDGGDPAGADAGTGRAGAKRSGSELDGKLAADDFPDEPPGVPPVDEEAARKRKRQRLIIGGSVAAAVVITLVLAFSGGDPPKLPPQPDPVVAETPKPAPPPKPPEPKKAPPPVIFPIAPGPRTGGEPARYVATQLIAERAANPVAFDENHRGRPVLLVGAFSRVTNGLLFLEAGPDGVGGVTCVPLKITSKPLEDPLPETKDLTVGQLVTVRGWYGGELRLTDCTVLGALPGPADAEYRDKDIDLVGTVLTASETDGSFPTVVLAPPTTDSPVSVRCLFRPSEQEKVAALRPNQPVRIRGRCAGRTGRVVRVHNCTLLANTDPPGTGIARVPAARFFAVYETGLLPFTRPDLSAPVGVLTADQCAAAYGTDPRQANTDYLYKAVQVSGTIDPRSRDPKAHTIVFETGTHQRYKILVALTPSRYGLLRDRQQVTIRGACVGLGAGPGGKYFVRIENGEPHDADAGNTSLRTAAEFLPFRSNVTLTYDSLTVTGHTSPYPITRFSMTLAGAPQTLLRTTLRTGNFPKPTFFGPSDPPARPTWIRDLTKQKGAKPTQIEFREVDGTVEVREKPDPAPAPGAAEAWWDPVLRIGYAKGETWSTKTPDGRSVTYKVIGFSKDEANKDTVEILRVMKDPTDVSAWDETNTTYTHGVGEVRRVVTRHYANGKSQTLFEVKLVDIDSPDEAEPKTEPKSEPKPEPKTEPKAAPDKKNG